jgi:hypothetical protein
VARQALAFISYNPYVDQRIDPLKAEDLYKYKDIPSCIHNAVRCAKELVNDMPIEKLKETSLKIDGYLLSGAPFSVGLSKIQNSNRDYCPTSQSDELKDFLEYGDHDEPDDNKSILFGVLALCLAGEIINILYPSKEYISIVGDELEVLKGSQLSSDEYKQKFVMDLAIEAVRSTGLGEGYLLGAKYRNEKVGGGKKSSKAHQELYVSFIDWALSQPENHGFLNTEDSVNIGFIPYLKESERTPFLSNKIGERTHQTLKQKLEDHCVKHAIRYPFPRKRSKRKIY